jgi:mannose-6-phosphate isomerase-like protein (cupin superfamily)
VNGTFPGGTAVSRLDVYDDAAPDGVAGGSPHLHLVSTESYVVVDGRGALQTIDDDGFAETELRAGDVVWFTPGTIHRAVNRGGLRVVVLMSNAGLPEAGDAVMTFPAEIVADRAAYREAADLGAPEGRAERAARRRDLAVAGFTVLRDALASGDDGPLRRFRADAAALVRDRAAAWADIVRDGPLTQAQASIARAESIAHGDDVPRDARLHVGMPVGAERGFGMCGRLGAYRLG